MAVLNAGGDTIENKGKIFLDGDSSSWWGTKAIFADGGTATNNNLVYVKKAIGMQAGTGGNSTLINNGVIIVENGSGIEGTANNRQQTIKNTGTIVVKEGLFGFGIRVTDGDTGSVITNSGKIVAEDGATYAIYVGKNGDKTATGVKVNLEAGSDIEGLVALNNQGTELNVNGVSGEAIKLVTLRENGGAGLTVKLTNSDMTIEQGTDEALIIDKFALEGNSTVGFLLTTIGSKTSKVLTLGESSGISATNTAVSYSGGVSDALLTSGNYADLISGVDLGGGAVPEEVTVAEGAEGDALVVTDGVNGVNVQVTSRNSLLTSAQDVAKASAMMWRDQLSSLSDRMGTLRTMPTEVGSWARYTNGRLEVDSVEHDYNMIEVGFDKKITDNLALGASFSYTKGDTDVLAGTADNNTYTGGLYATYMNASNCFFDAMLKVGRIDAEYNLVNDTVAEKADYMMTGTILGIETGHRWTVNNFYVEPAIQVTYSYLRPESYESNVRHVSYEEMESLIARVGVTGGITFADKGAAYVGVSYNHDFMGEINGTYTATTTRVFEDQLEENWGEAKIGASYQVTNGLNAFADVATSFGGDVEQKWRVNVGARYVF
ncbi:autotransporter outer membrane beta-barrel domain-containing protein [Parasutterella secunda]|uniref:autotransporter outer membrane beta-barrel domain-containing protein n=1 Tax=Parasutterella secunda TaxID=626947 RepID=UPI0025A3DD2A|nr:autotransporter outer membrane beta-barrel domain-containing protein [Parasutterella secunda]MDM8218749.1 autotransporter outer membrane beta-barrel domain-containing protein [Parasutterella secunda]